MRPPAPPSGACLSPAGEYNLRLGVLKEINPEHNPEYDANFLVATATEKVGVFEGHPFLVEAAVSIGGSKLSKEGITVHRFANRIPLLFEAGGDVARRRFSAEHF